MLTLLPGNALPRIPEDRPGWSRGSRRQAGRRACRAVLWGLLLFALSQLALRIGIERHRPELRDPTFEIKYRALDRLRKKAPATVVFFGSSMTAHGMKADMVDEPLSKALGRPAIGFNLATSAAGPLTHLIYVQRLLRRGVRPDMAVIELSPLLYDFAGQPSDLKRFPAGILDSEDLKTVRRYSTDPDLTEEWWQAFLAPVYGHRLTILTQTAPVFVPFDDRLELWKDMDSHGWRKREVPSPEEHRKTLEGVKALLGKRLGNYAVAQTDLAALRELSALLARERIPTTMVVMPEGPLIRGLYRPAGVAEILAEFRRLADVDGHTLVDLREGFAEEDFIDSYHLASTGAEKLTSLVLHEAILPGRSSGK